MTSCTLSRFLLVTSVAATFLTFGAQAQPAKSAESLTVEDVVKLSKAGLSEELIITRIKKNGKAFDFSTEELLELKGTGVSETIIKFLMDPSQPYAPPPPPPPPPPPARPDNIGSTPAPPPPKAPAKQYPADPHASKVPPEPGLYRFPTDAPVKVDIQILLGTKEGPGLGKVVMKKGKIVAYLVGAASKTRIKEPAPVFYIRLPEGKAIEEIVLLAFSPQAKRREIEMDLKQELKPEDRRQFDSLEVGPGVFKLTAIKLTKGEYLFFQLGSAEPPKGSYGKGFDFGIEASPK